MSISKGLLISGIGIAVMSGTAQAQQTTASAGPSEALDEIVVTAQKRTENVLDVPIAVTVVSAEQLVRQHITELTDLSKTAPALEFGAPAATPGGGGILRGIGTNFAFSGTAEAAVGVVVDGVSQGNINISNIFDISRVEVLKGPQGMLFGQSTSAGVINITTNAPSTAGFSGSAAVEIGPNGFLDSAISRYVYQGMLNIPLSSSAALRITAHDNVIKGVQTNDFTHTEDKNNDAGGRARMLWNVTDDVAVNVIADYNEYKLTNGDFITYAVVPQGSYIANLLAACGITPNLDNGASCSGDNVFSDTKSGGASIQVDANIFGGHTLTSITAFRRSVQHSTNDVDTFPTTALPGLPAEPVQLGNDGVPSVLTQRQITQEVRLQSPSKQALEYTAGIYISDYYSNNHNESLTRITTPFFSVVAPAESVAESKSSSQALFGQLTWHVLDNWRLLAGGRYTNQHVSGPTEFRLVSNPSYDPVTYPTTPYTYTGTMNLTNFSWRLGTQVDVAPDTMAYFTVTRGYKGPQIDTTDNTRAPVFVQPEIPLDFEVGIKSELFDKRLYVDLDYFHSSVHDFQATNCRVTGAGPTAVNVCVETNIGHVITQGVEADLVGKPFRGMTVNAGFIYNPVKYPDGFVATDGTDLSGYQLAYAPRFKMNLSGEYAMQFGSSTEGFISMAGTYKSADRLYVTADPNVVYPSHWLVDGRIGVHIMDKYTVSLFGKNLFDKREAGTLFPSVLAASIDQNFGFPGSPYVVPGHPSAPSYMTYLTPISYRTIGIALEGKF
jgi:iron complex outermembrane recepter protein